MSDYYIGLSTSGHDPAFAIADEHGKIIFAESSERYTQVKRAWGIAPDHADHIRPQLDKLIEADPDATFNISTSWTRAKQDLAGDGHSVVASPSTTLVEAKLGQWIMGLQEQIHRSAGHSIKTLYGKHIKTDTLNFDHHLCHATNAVYSAPFDSGLVLVADGEGETGSISLFKMENRSLKRLWRSWGPGSLGTFYCWLTSLCGFDWIAGEEWKVMGLAAYGKPNLQLAHKLEQILVIEKGRPIFSEQHIISETVAEVKAFQRTSKEPVEKAADLAATGQLVYQRYMEKILDTLHHYNEDNLALSGGCALNSSYNGVLLAGSKFKQVHVPSAPADDGNALGAALLGWSKGTGNNAIPKMEGACYLGTTPEVKAIENTEKYSSWKSINLGNDSAEYIAKVLAEGKILGIFRGAAEFGPRALGHRSIFADPRPESMKDIINANVKGREAYRPFAPMILEEHLSNWFELEQTSPFMSFAYPFKSEKCHLIPAVVHADNTGRVQTVNKTNEAWLYSLLNEFYQLTGIPILLNTSFNIMGKPIVHSVQDAVAVFGTTGLDGLLLENTYFTK